MCWNTCEEAGMEKKLRRWGLMALAVLVMAVGSHFFLFPNQFCFGGVSGLSTIAARLTPLSAGTFNAAANLILLLAAFLFVGKSFAMTTAFASLGLSALLVAFEKWVPLADPLTSQPMLEFLLAVSLPSAGCALLFHLGASSGGTDIPAMILKKHAHIQNIGVALFWIDLFMVAAGAFVLDLQAMLYSAVGLAVKTFLIDDIIGSITMCKSVMVVCEDAGPLCEYITHTLGRGATVGPAKGAYTGAEQSIVFTTLTRRQANQLRLFIRQNAFPAFITMSSTVDVFGQGFANV